MGLFSRPTIKGAMARKIAKQLNLPRVVKMKDYLKDPSLNANNGMGLDTQMPVATDHKHSSDSNSNSGNFGPIGGDGVMDAEERADNFTSLNNNNMMNPNKFANYKMQEMGQNLFEGDQFAQQMASKRLDQPLPPPGSAPQSPYGDMNPIMNKDSREARRQERKNIRMANKGLRQARKERAKGVKEQGQENYSYDGYEKGRYDKKGDDIEFGKTPRYSKKNPPDGSDASFGISGYVNNKKEFNSALNFDNPQYIAKKDPNKGKPYVVNERPGVWQPGTEDRTKDTLFLPKSFKGQKGKMIGEDDYIDNAKVNKDVYFQVGVQDLEDKGRIKIRQ